MNHSKNRKFANIACLFILPILVACSNKTDNGRINMEECYKRIDILPLESSYSSCHKPKLAVYNKGFIVQEDSISLSFYDIDGSLKKKMTFDVVDDFSIYKEKKLYVLASSKIETYDLTNFTCYEVFHIPDTSFSFFKIAGRNDNVVLISALRDGYDYFCEYYIKEKKFYPCQGAMKGSNHLLGKVLRSSSYLYSEGELYFFYSNTGTVWRMADFNTPDYQYSIKHNAPGEIKFNNIQMTREKIFMHVEMDGDDFCVITEKDNPHASVLLASDSTHDLPLGVIYDNINYVLCKSEVIDKYVSRDLIDNEGESILDSLNSTISCDVIIKYHLR